MQENDVTRKQKTEQPEAEQPEVEQPEVEQSDTYERAKALTMGQTRP